MRDWIAVNVSFATFMELEAFSIYRYSDADCVGYRITSKYNIGAAFLVAGEP